MANYSGSGNNANNDIASWIVTIVFLVTPLWPIGLILLFRKLMGGSSSQRRQRQARHPYDLQQEQRRTTPEPGTQGLGGAQYQPYQGKKGRASRKKTPAPMGKVNLDMGKGLTIGGLIMAGVFAMGSISMLPGLYGWEDVLAGLVPCLGFMSAGLVMAYAGHQRNKKAKRYRKYLALIGKRRDISIATLAQAMPVSVHTACDDLQDMLDDGIIPTGYLDMGTGRLILSDEGLTEEPAPAPEPEEEHTPDLSEADAVLAEIRAVNDAIADPVMSRKIDRIGEITGKIFAYQKQNPGKGTQLRSFLSYYLPTTLKILKAYAQMEAQGIEGENISAAKDRIEGMMDKVVEGFEKQLDKLFQNDAMDITTDVEVLERMLDKDGLSSGGHGLTLGG